MIPLQLCITCGLPFFGSWITILDCHCFGGFSFHNIPFQTLRSSSNRISPLNFRASGVTAWSAPAVSPILNFLTVDVIHLPRSNQLLSESFPRKQLDNFVELSGVVEFGCLCCFLAKLPAVFVFVRYDSTVFLVILRQLLRWDAMRRADDAKKVFNSFK